MPELQVTELGWRHVDEEIFELIASARREIQAARTANSRCRGCVSRTGS